MNRAITRLLEYLCVPIDGTSSMPPLRYSGTIIIFAMPRAVLLYTACAPPATQSPPQAGTLIPYLTSTQSPPRPPEGLVSVTTPLPSPTPFTYTVQSGDSMSVIAEKFGVSLDDLQAANPEVSSNAMSVGQV